jgi:hypothetical protein
MPVYAWLSEIFDEVSKIPISITMNTPSLPCFLWDYLGVCKPINDAVPSVDKNRRLKDMTPSSVEVVMMTHPHGY